MTCCTRPCLDTNRTAADVVNLVGESSDVIVSNFIHMPFGNKKQLSRGMQRVRNESVLFGISLNGGRQSQTLAAGICGRGEKFDAYSAVRRVAVRCSDLERNCTCAAQMFSSKHSLLDDQFPNVPCTLKIDSLYFIL